MTTRRPRQQQQAASALVSMSGGKRVRTHHTLLDPLPSLQTSMNHFRLVKGLLQRHLGPVGNLLRRKDDDPMEFYREKVANTRFASLKPIPNEQMFVYLTRLIKHLQVKEKQQVDMAAKALIFLTKH